MDRTREASELALDAVETRMRWRRDTLSVASVRRSAMTRCHVVAVTNPALDATGQVFVVVPDPERGGAPVVTHVPTEDFAGLSKPLTS